MRFGLFNEDIVLLEQRALKERTKTVEQRRTAAAPVRRGRRRGGASLRGGRIARAWRAIAAAGLQRRVPNSRRE